MAWGRSQPQGVDDLCKRLRENDPKLQSLVILRFRRLEDADVEALATALKQNSSCTELICSSHSVSLNGSVHLGRMLQHNKTLQTISIGNSSWGDEALAALATGMRHNTAVTVWDLEHKGLTAASAGVIADVLQHHPRLQQLVLSRNSTFGDAGLAQICAGSAAGAVGGGGPCWRNLKQLELSHCGITAQGVTALAASNSLHQLQQLDLSHNPLGPSAGPALQLLLTNAKQLQGLKLQHTALEDQGVAGLAGGLTAASSLHHLDLSDTGLGSSGVEALAAALQTGGWACGSSSSGSSQQKQQGKLRKLCLAGNPDITDGAVAMLAQALTPPAAAHAGPAAAAGATAAASGVDAGSLSAQQQQSLCLELSQSGVGVQGLQALAAVPGLAHLSLFACKLGSGEGAPIAALQACLSDGGFADLRGLNLSGCQLGISQMKSLVSQLSAMLQQQQQQQWQTQPSEEDAVGGRSGRSGSRQCVCPLLETLEIGANPCSKADGFEGLIQGLRVARPGLDVHWRAVDAGDADGPPAQ